MFQKNLHNLIQDLTNLHYNEQHAKKIINKSGKHYAFSTPETAV